MSWRALRNKGGDIVLRQPDYDDSDELSMALVKEATAKAVEEALASRHPDVKVLVVNVNIQLASGGGATNIIGATPVGERRA